MQRMILESTNIRTSTPTTSDHIQLELKYLLNPDELKNMPRWLSSKFGSRHSDTPRVIKALRYFYDLTVTGDHPFVEVSFKALASNNSFPANSESVARKDVNTLRDLGLLIVDSGRRAGRANQIKANAKAIIPDTSTSNSIPNEMCSVA